LPVQRRVVLVAGVVRQAKLLDREFADQLGFFEAGFQLGIGAWVADPVVDRTGIRPQSVLALGCLEVVLELRTTGQETDAHTRRRQVSGAQFQV
jgi:hypothetical protein